MKLLKLLSTFLLFIEFNIVYTIQAHEQNTNASVLQFLYTTYDQHQNNFVNYLSQDIPLDQYKQILHMEQARLKNELDSLSYKNEVLLTGKGAKNIGLIVGNIVGIFAADWFMHYQLAEVAHGIGKGLAQNKQKLIERLQHDLEIGRAPDVQAFTPLEALRGGGNTIRWGSPYYPAESLVSQIIGKMYGSGENLSYSAYLTLYQLATKALTIGAVVGGVGLMQDIKAFQDKKKNISEQIDKCNKMLVLLEKA